MYTAGGHHTAARLSAMYGYFNAPSGYVKRAIGNVAHGVYGAASAAMIRTQRMTTVGLQFI